MIINHYKGDPPAGGQKMFANDIPILNGNPLFYDHIIRNEEDLNRIRKYIIENPIKWAKDEHNNNSIKQKNIQ
jgi:hypothetical protein